MYTLNHKITKKDIIEIIKFLIATILRLSVLVEVVAIIRVQGDSR